MRNIVLIGMPACGKSTVGVILAKTVKKDFVDTDISIQAAEERTLQDIIDTDGNEYFRKVEERVLLAFDRRSCVVSTGGSAIYYPEAMKKFKEHSVVVYIKVSLNTILERLNNIVTRGVTLEKGQTLGELYKERIPLYEKYADVTVEGDGLTTEEVVKLIAEAVE